MANGFFLGGVAEGLETAEKLALKRGELALDREMRGRSADVEERKIALTEKTTPQDLALRARALDIQERGQRDARIRELSARADKEFGEMIGIIKNTIDAGVNAGRTVDQIRPAIDALIPAAKRAGATAGRVPESVDTMINTMMVQPSPTEKTLAETKAKVTAARAVQQEAGVPEREAMQGQGLLRAEAREQSTLEQIRAKIAEGGQLSAGEKQVYDDAVKSEGMALLKLLGGLGAAPAAAPTATGTPSVQAPAAAPTVPPALPSYNSEAEVAAAMKDGKLKFGDSIIFQGRKVKVQP